MTYIFNQKEIVYTRVLGLFIFLGVMFVDVNKLLAIPITNLFEPYDILLFRPIDNNRIADFNIVAESAFNVCAFQTDPEDLVSPGIGTASIQARKRCNILQIWQDQQNATAALQAQDDEWSDPAQTGAKLNIEGQTTGDLLTPHAKLAVPLNLMLSARYKLPAYLTFGMYLPFYITELKDVYWEESVEFSEDSPIFNKRFTTPVSYLERAGNLDLTHGWRNMGIGDLSAVLWWRRDFKQVRDWLKNVMTSLRGGLTFPTGKKANINKLFPLPLGYDSGPGLIFGGTIEATYGQHVKFGVDAQFLYFLGTKSTERIKTDADQTDLIFLDRATIFKESGFMQHYTLYAKFSELYPGFACTLAYQNTNQQEDTLFANTSAIDAIVLNSAESHQNWATHSAIAMFDYNFNLDTTHSVSPFISGFAKWGFNGRRAILCSTIGLEIGLNF